VIAGFQLFLWVPPFGKCKPEDPVARVVMWALLAGDTTMLVLLALHPFNTFGYWVTLITGCIFPPGRFCWLFCSASKGAAAKKVH
jgi:hypothetical protein